MNYLKLASILIFSFASSTVNSQTMDLLGVYNQAQDRDPLIAAAKFQAQAGEEKATQGKSLLLPKLNAGASAGYGYSKNEYDSASQFDSSNKSSSYGVNAQLTQPIYHAADWDSYAQSKMAVDQAAIQLAASKQDLILRVTKAYFGVLSAEENVDVAEAETRALKESLDRAILTFKVGTATKTDKLEAQARYDIAVASEILAKSHLAVAKQTLASIIGSTPESLKKLATNVKLVEIQPTDMKSWVDTAHANNQQLKLSNLGLDISKLEVSKLKGDRLPAVDLIASASQTQAYQSFAQSDVSSTNLSLSLQLSVPIYTGGLLSSRIREAESLRLQQKQFKINRERQVELQTQQAYLNALSEKQRAEALRQAMLSNESALEATKKGVEVGVRTNLDLLDAQQLFFGTQRDFTVSKYDYLLSVLQLKAAAGVLAENDIEELNALLTMN